ncbi:hypothetical protein HYFRA_00007281 [Hymenoscyphus fraxineus]|uniref:Heterokaryon incompatibility domain-containing protein n=1 Tax=Hymenoscyphus fraxineus TaxID=746836 RepID=A0A9N9KQ03_9HELO|nr:hypothetical protein HYFRA_00007281 [Hymenoscyphus fraxineus]
MELCVLCQNFDIRALLLASAAQPPESTGNADRNFVDAQDFRPPIPHFYPHYTTILDLKHSAEKGCPLCTLLWDTWMATLPNSEFPEGFYERIFDGQIFIGSSGWMVSRQGVPYVTVGQKTVDGKSRTLCSFEAFAERDEMPEDGPSVLCTAISADSASESCVALGRNWLDICLEKHEKCRGLPNTDGTLPTRVIDVGDKTQHPRLITTNSKNGTFIALSYCWGGASDFVLNDDTMPSLTQGVSIHEFPATLRDAVIITRNLGIQYIWIDALCIKQDSKEDWAREAAKMREVYSGAILTVTASNAPSTTSGIFSSRANEERGPINVYLRPGSELWDHKLQGSRPTTRGWTLQEALLAPRTLSYGEQQMIWECPQYQADEGGRVTSSTEDYRSKGLFQEFQKIGSRNSSHGDQVTASRDYLPARYHDKLSRFSTNIVSAPKSGSGPPVDKKTPSRGSLILRSAEDLPKLNLSPAYNFFHTLDDFRMTTWILMVACFQAFFLLFLPVSVVITPPIAALSSRIIYFLLVKRGIVRDSQVDGVRAGKYTAQIPSENGSFSASPSSQEVVVFILGARSNHNEGRFAPGFKAFADVFGAMWQELGANRTKWGYLGKTSTLYSTDADSGNTMAWISYWKSLEHLQAFAKSPVHQKGLNLFYEGQKKHPHLGIMHETYSVPKGHWETVYHNFKPFGFGQTKHVRGQGDNSAETISPLISADGPSWSTMAKRMGKDSD